MIGGGYRRKYGPESIVELSKNIIVQHEDFLKQDDPDKKADALRYMAGYAAQYLQLVPQEKKFTFKETERVLHNSAMNIAVFDPREASLSFCSLAKYAENLLEQPWRKEFHVIKLTSGFYVHNVAAQLKNAHEILIALGYVNIDDTTLKLLPNTNYANMKAVSRDCYIASQECLILSQIWQRVADQEPDYPLTIGEVFEYRKTHLGDTDTICNKLVYDIRARMHAVKQAKQQQLQQFLHNNNQPLHMIKNAHHRYVPTDRLIDYEESQPSQMSKSSHRLVPIDRVIDHDDIQQLPMLKNSQRFIPIDRHKDYEDARPLQIPNRFVPIDRLIDYEDEMNADEPDGTMPQTRNLIPEREIERTQDLMKNVNLYKYSQDDEHIYDPVYGGSPGDISSVANHQYQQQHQRTHSQSQELQSRKSSNNLHGQYFYNSVKPVPAQATGQPLFNYAPCQSQHLRNNVTSDTSNNLLAMYGGSSDRSSMSPMIPKTVTSFFATSNPIQTNGSSRNIVSKSNSMNSISGNRAPISSPSSSSSSISQTQPYATQPQPLTRSKVKETDLDADVSSRASSEGPRNFIRNEDLNSLDTVYYDYLLKKGHTDEVMGNNRVDSPPSQVQPDVKRASSSSRTSHNHHNTHNQNNCGSSEAEENHIYDGRRVIPKKKQQRDKTPPRRLENDTRRRKQQNSYEGNVAPLPPDSKYDVGYNDNLSSAVVVHKPSIEKNVRKSNEREYRKPVESEAPSSSSPSASPPRKIVEPWDCRHCTFRNLAEERICEVCAKSKDFYEEDLQQPTSETQKKQESQPQTVVPKMYSVPIASSDEPVRIGAGPSSSTSAPVTTEPTQDTETEIECPQCTLLNPKVARVCDACNFRFKKMDSPKNVEDGSYDIR